MKNFEIRRVNPGDLSEWLRMRILLWPDHTNPEMLAEMEQFLAAPEETPVFVAERISAPGMLAGFLEGGIRTYGEGCDTSPVAYIEGWFVDEDVRNMGIGGNLVHAMEEWARQHNFTEIGSDTWLDNETSIQAHQRLGYEITERLVHFAKKL